MSSRREESRAETEWDAYSDYQHVSRRVAKSIGDAVDAISIIDSGDVAGEKLSSREETDLRADVLGAVIRLQTELENERETKAVYDEILTRWQGDDGYVNRFRALGITNLQTQPWLQQFATDIHRAGWELGYLKAGREEKQSRGGDAYDGEVRDMIEEMTI